MDRYVIFGTLSVVFFVVAYFPYIRSIAKGKTKPHPFSWTLWTLIGIPTVWFYFEVGARETLPIAIANVILPLVTTILSIRNWKGKFSRFDYLCLFLSLFSIGLYIVYRNAAFSLTINLAGDLLAYLPSYRKAWKDPSSEDLTAWLLYLSGYISAILAIREFSYGVLIYPLYLGIAGLVMVLFILRGRLKKRV